MSDYIKEKKTEEFEKYISSESGYVPHGNQTKAYCPMCGCGLFKSYPQAVNVSAPTYAWEYTCSKCGWILAIEVKKE